MTKLSKMYKEEALAKKYGVPLFEDLQISTRTVMAYNNMYFNLPAIFRNLPITSIDVPLTKKKKNVDKKRLKAPYGAIISVQRANQYRGIGLKKSKKHWCAANCREITYVETNYELNPIPKRVNTVIEQPHLIEGTDIYEIKYWCTKCKNYYTLKQLEKIVNFLNQVTIEISIGNVLLNIMMFKDNFKIAGCKRNKDAVEAAMILWQDYIRDMGLTAIHFDDPALDLPTSKKPSSATPVCNFDDPNLHPRNRIWQLKPQFSHETPRFIFRLVMRNVDFHLGFFINRKALNRLMNEPRYADQIKMSQCETTGHANVNIKMYTKKPEGYMYNCLVYPLEGSTPPHFIRLPHNPYKPAKKPTKKKYTTFIVFSSSEIILTGRYKIDMRKSYYFFIQQVFQHRREIEEKISAPKLDLISFLKGEGEKISSSRKVREA